MFSTNTGEARPVRRPANSCCTICSVLVIFSSASRSMSSKSIKTSGWSYITKGSSACHQCSDRLAQNHRSEVMGFKEIKDDDRHLVVHAQRKGRRVHHLQPLLQGLQITDMRVTLGLGVLFRV